MTPTPNRIAWRDRIRQVIPARRPMLKALHWVMVPLFIWFLLVKPKDVTPFGPAAFQAHSILALIFVSLSLLWLADMMRRGLASRPGPMLKGWLRPFHSWMHRILILGLFFVALTGYLLGLTSSILLKAGGFLPIAPPLGLNQANDIVGTVHIVQFYTLGVVAGGHALFHIWRHYRLKDNALRIMVPKRFHPYL
jgi:cytochrome b561